MFPEGIPSLDPIRYSFVRIESQICGNCNVLPVSALWIRALEDVVKSVLLLLVPVARRLIAKVPVADVAIISLLLGALKSVSN